jgi:hypothetical protein
MKGKNLLKAICETYSDVEILKADGLDGAVIGIDSQSMRLIYSVDECVKVLVKRDGMAEDEAREFLEFNTFGAYVGPKTPIFMDNQF